LQALFEQTFLNKESWRVRAYYMTIAVEYFGQDREPKDVFRQDVDEFRDWLRTTRHYAEGTIKDITSYMSGWWIWMQVYGITLDNPWRPWPEIRAYRKSEYKYMADVAR